MTPSQPDVLEVEPHEAIARRVVLLDVREDDEWVAGHAPNALHMALNTLVAEYTRLDRTQSFVCVCRSGGRSARAAAFLQDAGYDVLNLAGGMRAWAVAGLPVVTDGGGVGSVI